MPLFSRQFIDYERFNLPTNERKLAESCLRYASILSMVSLFLMIEGTIRFISYKAAASPSETSELETRAITGGSFEIFFGSLGFLLGISILNFDFHWKEFTLITVLIEIVLGIFVFIIFTLEIPIRWGHESHLGEIGASSYPPNSLSDHEATVALVFGNIFGGICLCALLQSLQLICTIGILSLQMFSNPLSSGFLKIFSSWATGLVLLFGVSTIIFGVTVLQEEGTGLSDQAYIFSPHVVKYANHSITSGVFVTILGMLMVGSLISFDTVIPFATFWAILTWIWLITDDALAQISLTAADTGVLWAAAGAQLVGLYTILVFGPLFLIGEMTREHRQELRADIGNREIGPDTVKLSGEEEFEGMRRSIGGL